MYNRAVLDSLIIRDGRIAEPKYAEAFARVLGTDQFEQRRLERETELEPATSSLEGMCSDSYSESP